MENILKNLSLSDVFIFGFFFGMLFSMLHDVVISLTNYLTEKSWRISDYERIIYENLEQYDVFGDRDKELVSRARVNYLIRLKRKNRLDNLISKFKRKG